MRGLWRRGGEEERGRVGGEERGEERRREN